MGGGEFRGSDGDWTCPDPQCGNVNFARRMACNRCGLEKKIDKVKKQGTEIGSAAAEKSKGLFAADDWQCSKCGNVNWARRSTCNVCNAPKFSEVEERTGLGGGFDERGIVEYKERPHSDDDEYDDFGRKKKRKGEVKQPPQIVNEPDDVDDDDEEEEEEEDDDLSKYDLWGSDDKKDEEIKDAPPVKEEKPPSKGRGRSRSKSPLHKGKKSRRSRR